MNEPDRTDGRARLKEIMSILARHEVARGVGPDKLVAILTDLGPTFVKLGQILSMRPDILPKRYCEALEALRSDVAPLPFAEVRAVVEESLGQPLEELFASFEQEPLGSASIAQAHRATLPDGQSVVVKVQRPNIREVMERDISLLRRAFALVKKVNLAGDVLDFNELLEEMWKVTQQEMDFLQEAANLREFQEKNPGMCPRVYPERTARGVLTMEYVQGSGVSSREELLAAGLDPDAIGRALAHSYVKQVIEDGFFHADPHPGNIRVREGRIVWIDMGMMGRLTERDRSLMRQAVAAMSAKNIGEMTDVVLALGETKGHVNRSRLFADIDDLISRYGSMDLGGMNLGKVLEDVLEAAAKHQIGMPSGLAMLSRGMVTLEGVLADLSPGVNVVEITAEYVKKSMFRHVDWGQEAEREFYTLLTSARRAGELPSLSADTLRLLLKGQLRRNFDLEIGVDTESILARLLDRLGASLVTAALIIAGSLLVLGPAPWTCAFPYAAAGLITAAKYWKRLRRRG